MAIEKRLPVKPAVIPGATPFARSTPPLVAVAGSASSATSATSPATTPVERGDDAKKQLGQSVDKTPVHTGAAGNSARTLHLDHVKSARDEGAATVEQRKFLRTAYKELAKPGAHLDDHLAFRSLAAEQGALKAFDEILQSRAPVLLPELLERAHVFVEPAALQELAAVADAMGERAAFDVHMAEQFTVARSWAKNDDDRREVETVARSLGLSMAPPPDAAAPSTTLRPVLESVEAARISSRMRTKNPAQFEGYKRVVGILARGEAGKNQHALSRELAGQWAIDLPGSGAGRGQVRVVYQIVDDKVLIRDITDYH